MTWEEAAEVEWASGACDIPCREEDLSAQQPLSVHEFVCWMQQCQDAECMRERAADVLDGLTEGAAAACGFRFGRALLSLLQREHEDVSPWDAVRRVLADIKEKSVFRAAQTIGFLT